MKFSAVAAVAFAALAHAQTRADIPTCALPCLDDAVTSSTKCSTTDIACVCKNFDAVQGAATACVLTKCGQDVALTKVLPATQALCKNPAPAPGSSSAPAGTTSAASTTAPATTSSAASSPASAPPSSASAPPASSNSTSTSTTSSSKPTSSTPVSGAAGLTSLGGLAILALGVLAL